MSYKIICNISDLNLPGYKQWSERTDVSARMVDGPESLTKLKIGTRSKAAQMLRDQYGLPEIDSIADPMDMERWKITDPTIVNKIADFVGLRKPSGRVQVLTPGAMLPLHLDNLEVGYLLNCEDSYQNNEFTQQEIDAFYADRNIAQRVLIMLEDWKPGQYILFGEDVFSHWQAGDVVHWHWQTVIHSTINAGYWNRPLLRLSGFAEQKFFDLVSGDE